MLAARADWESVALKQRTPMQHHIWMRACAETLAKNGRARLFAIGDIGERRAMAAFVQRGWFPKRLFLMGAEELGEATDVACSGQEAAEEIAKAIIKAGLPIRLGHFPAQSDFATALRTIAGKSGAVLTAPVNGAPFIPLDPSWVRPVEHFNTRRRSDLRRMRRKAEAIGEIEFKILSPAPENVDTLLGQAIAVEAEGWKARSGTAIAHNRRQELFFRRYAQLASQEGILRICFMKIGGEFAAMQIAVECDNGFWLLKIGYDERFAKCSPGNLLLLETVRYAAANGLARFEFLGKSAPWTRLWTEDERPNIRLRYYPSNLSGYIALGIDGAEIAIRRIRSKLGLLIAKQGSG